MTDTQPHTQTHTQPQETIHDHPSLKDMRTYIYEKLKSNPTQIQGDIYNYIEMKNATHTKNTNGIFVNVSTLDDIYVRDIYDMICYHKKHIDIPMSHPELQEKTYETPVTIYKPYSLTPFQARIVNLI